MRKQNISATRDQLYISHAQIFTYLNCSLKYLFKYVQQIPAEHSNIALHFGSAIHNALEIYYLIIHETGEVPALPELEKVFSKKLYEAIQHAEVPIIWNNEMPDTASAMALGKKMLQVFHNQVSMDGYKIEAVELQLSAPLYNHYGEPMDIKLLGYIDLVLRDQSDNILLIDHKTAKQKKSQLAIDNDLQMTAYSYLMAANRLVFPKAEVRCRFDVLRKLKTPKLEYYYTNRGSTQRRQFARLVSGILSGIDNRVFLPCHSWLCRDCEYSTSCRNW